MLNTAFGGSFNLFIGFGSLIVTNLYVLFGLLLVVLDFLQEGRILDHFLICKGNFKPTNVLFVVQVVIELKWLSLFRIINLYLRDVSDHLEWKIELVMLE